MDHLAGLDEFVRKVGADAERLLGEITGAGSPWAAFQRPGDIVLTRGRRPLSHLNAVLQSVIEGCIARATHAMMVAAPGCYVDASIRYGVTLVPAAAFSIEGVAPVADHERLEPVWQRRLVGVFRHPEFARSPDRQRALAAAIAAQLGQPYNRRFIFKRAVDEAQDSTAFCSELVARTFARLGMPLVPGRRFASVLPETLRRSLLASGWQDVSQDYRLGGRLAA